MKTTSYNPSRIELEFARAIEGLKGQIESQLTDNKVVKVESRLDDDNPLVKFNLQDGDGDHHEVILRIIQLPDK